MLEQVRNDPSPDIEALRSQLHDFRSRAGFYFNVEHPRADAGMYALPLSDEDLEEVYGNALYNMVAANYLALYIKELEELGESPAPEC